MAANGNGHAYSRTLKAGVWAPIPTFFDENEDLDVATFRKHVVRLAQGGMQPVVCGSMGEAHHLSHDERATLFREARSALDEAGLTDTVIIAGTGAGSTRETVALCKTAADAGADVAIVIAPGYFQFAMNRASLKTFFIDVAKASPIPVMMYNFPGAAGGLDLDSELVSEIAREAPNICGIKLTCGAVGKLTRICANTATSKFSDYPRQSSSTPDFITLGGFADFLLPTVVASRAHGAIMGLGNIYPKALNKLMELSLKGDIEKALPLQDLASATDAAFVKVGTAGTKAWLSKHYDYPSARMRRPLLESDAKAMAALEQDPDVIAFLEIENSL